MRALLAAAVAVSLTVVQDKVKEGAPNPEAVLKEFKEAYLKAGKSDPARVEAVRILGKAPHLKTLSALSQLLKGDGSGMEVAEVRVAAADTIGTFRDVRGAWSPVADVARLRDRKITTVRVASARAVGRVGQREGLRVLQELADDKPFELAREAVLGLGLIPDRSSVPLLIKLLREVERVPEDQVLGELPFGGWGVVGGSIVDDARAEQVQRREVLLQRVLSTLKGLTGQGLGTFKEYQKWWSSNSSSFKLSSEKR